MSHQDLVLQALGMDNYDNALDLMKQIADEFITEQENEDILNKEIDTLLDGVDFSEPLSPMDQKSEINFLGVKSRKKVDGLHLLTV